MEQEKRIRREIANSNERRRMESINAGFQTLKTLLPRKDGEKISKASILQQTSEFITQLQREKANLTSQLMHYKTILETGGLKQLVEPSFLSGADFRDSIAYEDLPLKKRRKFETISTDSSDEGLEMMSDPETRVKKQKYYCTPPVSVADSWCQTIDEPPPAAPVPPLPTTVQQEKLWESELLQRQLMDIQLDFARERRLRVLLQDQIRNIEINRLQSLGRLSLLDYSPAFQTVLSSPLLSAAANYGNLLMGNNNTSTTTNNLSSGKIDAPAPQQRNFIGCSPPPTAVNSSSAPQQIFHQFPPAVPPLPNNNCNGQQSRQSLEVIVEAIRHLEGDQLFVDDSLKWQNQSTQTLLPNQTSTDLYYS